jgi:hypothetical protein
MKKNGENPQIGKDSPTIHDKLPPLAKPVGMKKSDPGKTTMKEKAPEPLTSKSLQLAETLRPSAPVLPISQKLKKANSQPLKKAKSVNIKHLIEADVEGLKKQLQCYSEIFDKIDSNEDIDVKNIIDPLNMLCRSLHYEAVSVLIVDPDAPGKFLPFMSRGYKNPPPLEVATLFEESIRSELPGVDWNKLMDIAGVSDNLLGEWIMSEGIKRIGYSPVHDGAIIHGMIIAASYGAQQPSQLASPLLELCGSRLGLHIGVFRHKKVSASASLGNIPIDEIKNKFSVLKKYMELLQENKKLSEVEIANLVANCDKALDEGIDVLEKASKMN